MARIVVIGGVNSDEALHLDRALRPGGSAAAPSVVPRPGGGGANAAVALAMAGHAVTLCGVVGRDAAGAALRRALAARGLELDHLRRRPGPTTRMLILIEPDGERTVIRAGPHRAAELEPADIPPGAAGMFVKAASPAISTVLAREAARPGRGPGAGPGAGSGRGPVLVAQIPPPGFTEPWPADVLVGARKELPEEAGGDPFGWARRRSGERLRGLVLTDGARGAVVYGPDGRVAVPAPQVRQVDATGAGDAFAAGLLDALLAGAGLVEAAVRACHWGAAAVSHSGSILPSEAQAWLAPE